jgi:hypothetical protein
LLLLLAIFVGSEDVEGEEDEVVGTNVEEVVAVVESILVDLQFCDGDNVAIFIVTAKLPPLESGNLANDRSQLYIEKKKELIK